MQINMLEELETRLAGHPAAEVLEQISEALDSYDFDQALELFDRINLVNLSKASLAPLKSGRTPSHHDVGVTRQPGVQR